MLFIHVDLYCAHKKIKNLIRIFLKAVTFSKDEISTFI